jgi:uncharacterized protein YneF (UPF0154 family)
MYELIALVLLGAVIFLTVGAIIGCAMERAKLYQRIADEKRKDEAQAMWRDLLKGAIR